MRHGQAEPERTQIEICHTGASELPRSNLQNEWRKPHLHDMVMSSSACMVEGAAVCGVIGINIFPWNAERVSPRI